MVSVLFLLIVGTTLNWAIKCDPKNYEYKAYGGAKEHGYGCKTGCVGWYNGTDPDIGYTGAKVNGEGRAAYREQKECVECAKIDLAVGELYYYYDNSGGSPPPLASDQNKTDYAKKFCGENNQFQNCHWKKGKCAKSSCATAAALTNCDEGFGHVREDGKCKRVKGDKCKAEGYSKGGGFYKAGPVSMSNFPDIEEKDALCKDLGSLFSGVDLSGVDFVGSDPYTDDDAKRCKFECEHRHWSYYVGGPSDYTKDARNRCHKLYGCMYSEEDECSALAIWAFVLILVFSILIFLAIVAGVIILIYFLCFRKKSTKVDPADDKSASASKSAPGAAAGAPATQNPPPEVGFFVVIKVGKQESKTKKVESAEWGQSIVFTGMGPEDDDVVFELHDDSGALLGSTDVRIPDYVNTKKRAAVNLKNGEVAIGVLMADIEIQVQEEPEVKITGVFYVDKFVKA